MLSPDITFHHPSMSLIHCKGCRCLCIMVRLDPGALAPFRRSRPLPAAPATPACSHRVRGDEWGQGEGREPWARGMWHRQLAAPLPPPPTQPPTGKDAGLPGWGQLHNLMGCPAPASAAPASPREAMAAPATVQPHTSKDPAPRAVAPSSLVSKELAEPRTESEPSPAASNSSFLLARVGLESERCPPWSEPGTHSPMNLSPPLTPPQTHTPCSRWVQW